jgi:hypothetical protein
MGDEHESNKRGCWEIIYECNPLQIFPDLQHVGPTLHYKNMAKQTRMQNGVDGQQPRHGAGISCMQLGSCSGERASPLADHGRRASGGGGMF